MELTAPVECQGQNSVLSPNFLSNAEMSTDDELRRRQLRRERNMRAAKRCRERREEERRLVDEEIQVLEKENQELRAKINTLMQERECVRRLVNLPLSPAPMYIPGDDHTCDIKPRSYNSSFSPDAIQSADQQMVHNYKVLKRTADKMCSWEDVEILATWLEFQPQEVRRLRSEKETLRSAAYQILTSFYDRTSVPNAKRWEMIRDALCEMNKNSAVKELGIDQLIQETVSDSLSEMDLEEIRKENQRLNNGRLCKVRNDTEANEVFLPCGHLSDCRECIRVTTCRAGQKDPIRRGHESELCLN